MLLYSTLYITYNFKCGPGRAIVLIVVLTPFYRFKNGPILVKTDRLAISQKSRHAWRIPLTITGEPAAFSSLVSS